MRCSSGQRQTCNASGNWQNTGSAMQQLLRNPNFDNGAVDWTETGDAFISHEDANPDVFAHTPFYLAWLGGYDEPLDEVFQEVTIPASATSITLSFYYNIVTEEVGATVFDTMEVYFWEKVNGMLTTYNLIAELNDNMQTNFSWVRFSATLPASLAGKTGEIGFYMTGDASLVTSMYVDTVALEVNGCPATP